jgi:hypothetical protein
MWPPLCARIPLVSAQHPYLKDGTFLEDIDIRIFFALLRKKSRRRADALAGPCASSLGDSRRPRRRETPGARSRRVRASKTSQKILQNTKVLSGSFASKRRRISTSSVTEEVPISEPFSLLNASISKSSEHLGDVSRHSPNRKRALTASSRVPIAQNRRLKSRLFRFLSSSLLLFFFFFFFFFREKKGQKNIKKPFTNGYSSSLLFFSLSLSSLRLLQPPTTTRRNHNHLSTISLRRQTGAPRGSGGGKR